MEATLTIVSKPLPLATDATGVVLVGGTRIPLDTLITLFHQGETAEEIAQQFPSLRLADIYAAITYYLQNQEEVALYLTAREQQAQVVREENERRYDPNGIRARLLARQENKTA